MRYQIISKNDELSNDLANIIETKLNNNNFIKSDIPELVISIGGDGTMLRAIHTFLDILNEVSFVGIHTGTLGFFTNYTSLQVDDLINDILFKKPTYHENRLLEICISGTKYYAINELRIENIYHTQSIDMYINEDFLQTFKGNGVCLSSSAGSTGYNRSLNGPIVDANLQLMILTGIAGIHHREFKSLDSSLVMGENTNFKMCLKNHDNAVIGIDYFIIEPQDKTEIVCKLSDKKWRIAIYEAFSYPKRLRRAFLE